MPFGNNMPTTKADVFRTGTSEMMIKGRTLRCTLDAGLPHRPHDSLYRTPLRRVRGIRRKLGALTEVQLL